MANRITPNAYDRLCQRYHWLRQCDVGSERARKIAQSVERFREFVRSEGLDPDTLGAFAIRQPAPSRDGSKRRPSHDRWLQRFHWARQHGCSSRRATEVASNIPEFRAFVAERGHDPDALGEFARKVSPAHLRKLNNDARNIERRRIYSELKLLGATADQATEGASCPMGYARVMRELRGPFRQQKDNTNG